MPRMSGAELAAALSDEQPGLKVLYMTGHTDDPALLGGVDVGAIELIQKPFTSEALLGLVRRLLGPTRASA
jgi:two-component system, cell cycle sensor histidine kinase and response regulator CckA